MLRAALPVLLAASLAGCGREKPVEAVGSPVSTPRPTVEPEASPAPPPDGLAIEATAGLDSTTTRTLPPVPPPSAEQMAIDASVTSGLPMPIFIPQTNPVSSEILTTPTLLTTWLDDGSTISEDFIPEAARVPDPEPGEGASAALFLFDRMARRGAAGVELEPFDDALPRRPITTNSDGVAYIRFKKDVEPRPVRLKVLGNWLPYEPGGRVELKRAELFDLLVTVPVRADGQPTRFDIYPAVEIAVGLVEGRTFYSAAPITWTPIDAIAANSLTYVPDNSEANFPRVKVPARRGDIYSISIPETYLGEARELMRFTLEDVSRPQFYTIDLIRNVITEGLPK